MIASLKTLFRTSTSKVMQMKGGLRLLYRKSNLKIVRYSFSTAPVNGLKLQNGEYLRLQNGNYLLKQSNV